MQRRLGVLELGLSVLETSRWWAPRATSAADGSPAYKGFDKCFNFKVHKSFQIKRRKSATMLVELTLANV